MIKYNNKIKKIINLTKSKDFDLKKKKGQIYPFFNKNNESYLIYGKSGSGKSYFAANLLKLYNKLFKDKPIFVISNVRNDKAYKNIQNLIYVEFDKLEKLLMNLPELRECAFLFDDADNFADKNIKNLVNTIKKQILMTGRHRDQIIIICTHILGGLDNRDILSEIQNLVIFLKSRLNQNILKSISLYGSVEPYILESLINMDKQSRFLLLNLDSNGYAFTSKKFRRL